MRALADWRLSQLLSERWAGMGRLELVQDMMPQAGGRRPGLWAKDSPSPTLGKSFKDSLFDK